ncbi:MAG: metallophosphoesterase [Terracidiphilus sp.]
MHDKVGEHSFVQASLTHVNDQVTRGTAEVSAAIGEALGTTDQSAIAAGRATLSNQLSQALQSVQTEPSHQDVHFVSRFDLVGLFQSALGKVFSDIPDLQRYGDKNPAWLATIIEEITYDLSTFFQRVYTDVHGNKRSLLHSVIAEWHQLRNTRAPFPPGSPRTIPMPENASVVLLGDWGGDNDAARNVAAIVRKHNPSMGVHLGDIYYGGTKAECDSFLRLWPFHVNPADPNSAIIHGSSLALNGNHEMYSGGESYFNTVLPAMGQPQSFFCLENQYWRIVGLDTAYAAGHLKPNGPDDPITTQWNWLVNLLKSAPKRANIFLTHHQPVSAHTEEWTDSKPLRQEIEELLASDGIGQDAIFGWFFGHEHRCAIYQDDMLPYNARLIGNGCIPHEVQREKAADPGCTPIDFVNNKETHPGSNTAVSSFAELRFDGPKLVIDYCNEDDTLWGTEQWDATAGRDGGVKFTERICLP